MQGGIRGRILRVDLDSGAVTTERPEPRLYRSLLGGRGMIAHYLLREVPQGADPLGPENLLIFATGALTGAPIAGSGRHSVGAKSPLTGGYGDSEAGGYWGMTLKRAGYDAVLIRGRASEPVYLFIDGGDVSIRPADHLWGRSTGEVQEILLSELGDDVRVAQCGPAGEKGVRYACVLHDLTHISGRTGIGAVMGSKMLRAVVVRGDGRVPVVDRQALKELVRSRPERKDHYSERFSRYGTSGILTLQNKWGGLPTRNFRSGQFEQADAIDGQAMNERFVKGSEGCYACWLKCKRVVEAEWPYPIQGRYGGPEYETAAALGSFCGVGDIAAICKGHELCGALGLDTISTGVAIGFAMECTERGLLPAGQGVEPNSAGAMLRTLEMIGRREGIGDLLAEGVKRAAEGIGGDAVALAMHVKGQEIPMHEPRIKYCLALGYAVSPTGADHNHNIHDNMYEEYTDTRTLNIRPLGVLDPLPATAFSPAKVRMFKYVSSWRHLHDCLGLCFFVGWDPFHVSRALPAVTGWDVTFWEQMKASERAQILARCFNLREGFTEADDAVPARFAEPLPSGPAKGSRIDPEELRRARELYYDMMGLDARGVPTRGTFAELDIEWVVDTLRDAGVDVQ